MNPKENEKEKEKEERRIDEKEDGKNLTIIKNQDQWIKRKS